MYKKTYIIYIKKYVSFIFSCSTTYPKSISINKKHFSLEFNVVSRHERRKRDEDEEGEETVSHKRGDINIKYLDSVKTTSAVLRVFQSVNPLKGPEHINIRNGQSALCAVFSFVA